jgi:hypothetical protein
VRRRAWRTDAVMDLVDAEHDGFLSLPDPVTHRRRVAFIKPHYWVIVDDVSGRAAHELLLRFQFSPDRPVEILPNQWVKAAGSGRHGLLMRTFATAPLTARLARGELAPAQGWFSPEFGRRVAAPAACWSMVARLPVRLVTVLIPTPDLRLAPPHLSALMSEGPRLAGIVFGDGQEFVMVSDQEILLERREGPCAALPGS